MTMTMMMMMMCVTMTVCVCVWYCINVTVSNHSCLSFNTSHADKTRARAFLTTTPLPPLALGASPPALLAATHGTRLAYLVCMAQALARGAARTRINLIAGAPPLTRAPRRQKRAARSNGVGMAVAA